MSEYTQYTVWLKIFAPIVLVLETICGICLNVSVLNTPIPNKYLRGNLYVKDLTCINLIVSIFFPPYLTVLIILEPSSLEAFVIVESAVSFAIVSNSVSVFVVSFDRYNAIVKPHKITRQKLFLRAMIWAMSLLAFALPFLTYGVMHDETYPPKCNLYMCRHSLYLIKPFFIYEVFYTAIFVLVSILVILYYTSVYHVAMQKIKVKIHVSVEGTTSQRKKEGMNVKRRKRIARLSSLIVVSFILCWAPLEVTSWLQIYLPNNVTLYNLRIIALTISLSSNVINPLLYTCTRPKENCTDFLQNERQIPACRVNRSPTKICPDVASQVEEASIFLMPYFSQGMTSLSVERMASPSVASSTDLFTSGSYLSCV